MQRLIAVFRRTLKVLKPAEKRKFLTQALLSLFISVVDIVSLAVLIFLVEFYTGHQLPSFFSFLPNWLTAKKTIGLAAVFLLLFSLKNLAGYFILRAQQRYVFGIASRIARDNLATYFESNYSDYVTTDSAVHVRRSRQLPIEFCQYVLSGFQQVITESILVVLTVVAILFYRASLFLLLFIFLLPPVVLLSWLVRKKLKQARSQIKKTSEKTIQYLNEALASYVESNVYDKKLFFTNRYAGYQQKLNNYLADLQIVQGTSSRLVEVFAVLGFFILIGLSVLSESESGISVVTIGAFIAAAYKIIPGIVKVLNISGQIKTYAFTVDELSFSSTETKTLQHEKKLNSVEFKDVAFRYKNSSVFTNLNFALQAGEIIGIKGQSGIGKTTILNVLLGFLPAEKGTICFNGKPVTEAERKLFWNRIAYVKQQAFLMHNSIRTNVTLSENGFDASRLDFAIRVSGLSDFVDQFSESEAKEISEAGKNISGGQQQRVALARAFYKDADLLILDEPFNELDGISEEAILNQCTQLAKAGKMIVLVTHNEKNLSYCTKILSLNER